MNPHVIFICDTSGSMGNRDNGQSKAEYSFIANSGKLDNRLGALYSSIYKFINVRLERGHHDTISAVMTPGIRKLSDFDQIGVIAANRVKADKNFVEKYLLSFKHDGYENYGEAFKEAQSLIDKKEETVVIFLCDGISDDNGATEIVKNLKSSMRKRFSLFCITLGTGTYKKK